MSAKRKSKSNEGHSGKERPKIRPASRGVAVVGMAAAVAALASYSYPWYEVASRRVTVSWAGDMVLREFYFTGVGALAAVLFFLYQVIEGPAFSVKRSRSVAILQTLAAIACALGPMICFYERLYRAPRALAEIFQETGGHISLNSNSGQLQPAEGMYLAAAAAVVMGIAATAGRARKIED